MRCMVCIRGCHDDHSVMDLARVMHHASHAHGTRNSNSMEGWAIMSTPAAISQDACPGFQDMAPCREAMVLGGSGGRGLVAKVLEDASPIELLPRMLRYSKERRCDIFSYLIDSINLLLPKFRLMVVDFVKNLETWRVLFDLG